MRSLIEGFPNQLEDAIKIGKQAVLTEPKSPLQSVLICGLGGSGIGGTIASDFARMTSTMPITVCKGYFIPAFVDESTLVIISSYSGDTEETVECLNAALKRKAKIVCITSGGKVQKIASTNHLDAIIIPGGLPPRACLGYSFTQLIFIFQKYHLLPSNTALELEFAARMLKKNANEIIAEARAIAEKINGKMPFIYCTTDHEGVAIRLRQQLNENAKILCSHHVIPEMNHNELVGWAGGNDSIAVLLLRDKDEYERNDHRIELNKQIILKHTPHLFEIWSKGESPIERCLYLIHFGDWISLHLAEIRGVDAVEVNVINFLKGELSKK